MSIVTIIEKAFSGLLALLDLESVSHRRKLDHVHDKARNHRIRQDIAIGKMRDAGAVYRSSLYKEADKHRAAIDKANTLADKIRKVIE